MCMYIYIHRYIRASVQIPITIYDNDTVLNEGVHLHTHTEVIHSGKLTWNPKKGPLLDDGYL